MRHENALRWVSALIFLAELRDRNFALYEFVPSLREQTFIERESFFVREKFYNVARYGCERSASLIAACHNV